MCILSLPPAVASLLQEYDDLLHVYRQASTIRGIEHQIDLIPAASLNRAPYRTNP